MHDAEPAQHWRAPLVALPGRLRATATGFWDSLRTSLLPRTESEARIADRQLDILRENTRLIPYAIPVAAMVCAASVYKWVSVTTLVVWMVLLVMTAVIHEIAARHFDKRPRATVTEVQLRAMTMATICTVYLLVWTSFGIWAWSPDIVVSHYMVAFVLGCTLAAACTMGAVHTASVVGVALPAGLIMIARPIVADAFDPMTGFSIVYVLLMAAFAHSAHLTTARALRLENDRADLIDSLKRARDESDNARKRAEGANRARSEFLANMSHELRTPLNAIIGFSDIIRARSVGPTSDKYVEYAGFINESGNHLLALISGVLELAKIEAGRKALRDEDVDLALVIADAAEDAQPAARDREVTIEILPSGNLPHLTADTNAVREILHHLLSNAVKFTQPAGFVEIGAHMAANGEVTVTIADNGAGIDPAIQAQMFDRFGAGQHDVARANAGAGLGLPIVKGLVELHGGRVGLESAPGEGTRVSVIFPVNRVVQPAQLAAAS